jgi:hypothetical protein
MKVLGNLECEVMYRFLDIEISKEIILSSGVINKIKQYFTFNDVKIPKDIEKESISFERGRFVHANKEVLIKKLSIDSYGLYVSLWGDSKSGEAFLDKVCDLIDEEKIFESLKNAAKESQYSTEGKVMLDIDPSAFLSENFKASLNQIERVFSREDFNVEIHPFEVSVAFVLKPDIGKLSKKDLDIVKIRGLIRSIRPQSLSISIDSPDNFYKRIYTITARLSSDKWLYILETIEKTLSR